MPRPALSGDMAASSPSSWATAYWPISAFLAPSRMRRNARFARRSASSPKSAASNCRTRRRIQTRIGIATGLVVVGEIIGTGSAQERTIVGETPNLAARLQALAGPDTILVSESTRNLLGGLFELERTGEHELKGFARPVPAWRVRGEASVESRFAAIRAGRNLPLIGRAHEMGLMLERWRLARQGEGQIVTVIGEAGIGKSRSIEALQEALVGRAACACQFAMLALSQRQRALSGHPVSRSRRRLCGRPIRRTLRIEKLGGLFAQRTAVGPGRDSVTGRAAVDSIARGWSRRRRRRLNARRRHWR